MVRFLWILAAVGVGLWSLMCWAAYGLVDGFGWLAMTQTGYTPGFAQEPVSLAALFAALRSTGLAAVVVTWLMGSATILAVPLLASLVALLFGRREPSARPPRVIPPAGIPGSIPRPRDILNRLGRR